MVRKFRIGRQILCSFFCFFFLGGGLEIHNPTACCTGLEAQHFYRDEKFVSRPESKWEIHYSFTLNWAVWGSQALKDLYFFLLVSLRPTSILNIIEIYLYFQFKLKNAVRKRPLELCGCEFTSPMLKSLASGLRPSSKFKPCYEWLFTCNVRRFIMKEKVAVG